MSLFREYVIIKRMNKLCQIYTQTIKTIESANLKFIDMKIFCSKYLSENNKYLNILQYSNQYMNIYVTQYGQVYVHMYGTHTYVISFYDMNTYIWKLSF